MGLILQDVTIAFSGSDYNFRFWSEEFAVQEGKLMPESSKGRNKQKNQPKTPNKIPSGIICYQNLNPQHKKWYWLDIQQSFSDLLNSCSRFNWSLVLFHINADPNFLSFMKTILDLISTLSGQHLADFIGL